jgi:hypothetical protein
MITTLACDFTSAFSVARPLCRLSDAIADHEADAPAFPPGPDLLIAPYFSPA